MQAQLGFHHGMELRVSQAQVLLSELVQLPVLDLERRIHAELETNAALELPEPRTCPGCGHPVWTGSCRRCLPGRRAAPPANVASGPAPPEVVLTEAARLLRPGERAVAAHLLGDLDDHGLLVEPVEAVAGRLGVPVRTVGRVIEALRSSGWPGLCAATLTERLRLQVLAAGGDPPAAVAGLLAGGLDALARGGAGAAATATGLTAAEVGAALAWIRANVDAEPIRSEAAVPPAPVDLVVRPDGDGFVVDAVPGPWSAVRVAESYLVAAADPRVRVAKYRAELGIPARNRR